MKIGNLMKVERASLNVMKGSTRCWCNLRRMCTWGASFFLRISDSSTFRLPNNFL